jgi:thioester reductase-like protein
VNGYRQGSFSEEPTPPGQRFVNFYQQSKYEAENLVLEAMRRIPAAIYRISLVIAESESGTVSQFNYFHHLLRLLPGSSLPAIPGDPDVLVDLVPNDWVARALTYLFAQRFTAGSVRHLCAGPDLAIRLSDAIERVCRIVESHDSNTSHRQLRIPDLVSLPEYNRFLNSCRDPEVVRLADAVGQHVRLLAIRQKHQNTLAARDLDGSGILPPNPVACLENTTRFCLDTDWGRKLPQSATGVS